MDFHLSKYENFTNKIEDSNLFEKRKIISKVINHKCDLCPDKATCILKKWWGKKFYGCDGHVNYLLSKEMARVILSPYNVILKGNKADKYYCECGYSETFRKVLSHKLNSKHGFIYKT